MSRPHVSHQQNTGRAQTTDDPDEVFDLVDEHDSVIGTVRRGDAHRDPALLHRSVQVLVFGSDGRLLLQRRSATKDLFPEYLCASASGHVASGDGYRETAERECVEELGIASGTLELVPLGVVRVHSPMETELTALFVTRCDGPFHFHPTETDGGEWMPLDDALALRHSPGGRLTPALVAALDTLADGDARAALPAWMPPASPLRHGARQF